jgi:hypothetical protein
MIGVGVGMLIGVAVGRKTRSSGFGEGVGDATARAGWDVGVWSGAGTLRPVGVACGTTVGLASTVANAIGGLASTSGWISAPLEAHATLARSAAIPAATQARVTLGRCPCTALDFLDTGRIVFMSNAHLPGQRIQVPSPRQLQHCLGPAPRREAPAASIPYLHGHFLRGASPPNPLSNEPQGKRPLSSARVPYATCCWFPFASFAIHVHPFAVPRDSLALPFRRSPAALFLAGNLHPIHALSRYVTPAFFLFYLRKGKKRALWHRWIVVDKERTKSRPGESRAAAHQ